MGNFTQHPWILRFILRLLEGEKSVLLLLKKNPFPEKPPTFIKASLYEYHFASPENRKRGLWWERRYLGPYISPLSLEGALGAVDMYLPTTNGPTS